MNATDLPPLHTRTLPVAGQFLRSPCFFPSVSSVKTNLPPPAYLKVLRTLRAPSFLVSAYDVQFNSLQGKRISRKMVRDAAVSGSIILMDSGGYESYWRHSRSWNRRMYFDILKSTGPQLAFSFDYNYNKGKGLKQAVTTIGKSIDAHNRVASLTAIIPLIHATADLLPTLCQEVAVHFQPIMIAVAERDLGDGILERMATVARIRRALDKSGTRIFLHILGTGNPRSLLLLSMAGADCFDGLEWCQTVVDRNTALLHHFQQLDLLKCRCKFCLDKTLGYTQRTLAHNLLFYAEWTARLQQSNDNANARLVEAEQLLGAEILLYTLRKSGIAAILGRKK